MNKKRGYYQKLLVMIQALIELPDTGSDEDKTLRSVLMLLTQLRDSYKTEEVNNPMMNKEQMQYEL